MKLLEAIQTICLVFLFIPSHSSFARHAVADHSKIFLLDDSLHLVLRALDDDLIQIELTPRSPGDNHQTELSPMIAKRDYDGPTQLEWRSDGLKTSELRITVIPQSRCFIAEDTARGFLLGRFCAGSFQDDWKNLEIYSEQNRNAYGLGSYFHSPTTSDGDWIGKVWDPTYDSFGNRMRGFFGGANAYLMIPILYALGEGSKNYGIFLDQTKKQLWDLSSTPWKIGMNAEAVRFFILSGDNLRDLRSDYLELTGMPAVPPKKTFGLWVSEFGYESWGEVFSLLEELRREGFPLEGFGMDLQWFGGNFGDPDNSKMGTLTWDESRFPNFRQVINDLKVNQDIELMTIEEPYIASHLEEHRELATRGLLAKDCQNCPPTFIDYDPWWGRGGILDYSNPETQRFWHQYRRQSLFEMGISSHWLDLGEPEQYNDWAWYHGFPEKNRHKHEDIHNLYNFKWVESIYDNYLVLGNRERPMMLTRSGTAGIQRFGTSLWSGDIGTDWGNLRAQHNVHMHMSLSGIDYYGSDVGGFQRQRRPIQGDVDQLYTAWFANSALFDIPLRPHAWNLDKKLSTSPTRKGHLKSNLKNTLRRYQLTPYYYSLAHLAYEKGEAITSPAVYHFQNDDNLRVKGDLKMIGPYLYTKALADPYLTATNIYLPKGEWYDFEEQTLFTSSGVTYNDFPVFFEGAYSLPLFVRKGAILPLSDETSPMKNVGGRRHQKDQPATALLIRVYPDEEPSSFVFFEDDGYSFDYLKGQKAKINLRQSTSENLIKVLVSKNIGSFQMKERPLKIQSLFKNKRALSVKLNDRLIETCSDRIDHSCWSVTQDSFLELKFTQHDFSQDLNVEIEFSEISDDHKLAFIVCENAYPVANQKVYALGNSESFGFWQPQRALPLMKAYDGTWLGLSKQIPANKDIEWKCIIKDPQTDEITSWQPGDNNSFTTASPDQYLGRFKGRF